VYVREAKKFSALLGGEIWIEIHLNSKTRISEFIIGSIGRARVKRGEWYQNY
jgi:hypothetical protein